MIEQISIGLFIGLVCLWIGFRLGSGNDADMKRKQFRSNLELLARKLEAVLIRDLAFDAAGDSRYIKQFETYVSDVRPHIRGENIGRFDDACVAYKSIRFGAIGTLELNAEAEKAKAKLVSLLNEIAAFAK